MPIAPVQHARLAPAATGRIGPNAIIQTQAELLARTGPATVLDVLRDAGLVRVASTPPLQMVAEDDVRRLFIAVERHSPADAPAILHAAGGRTARYLLAYRIPHPAQWLMRCLPPRRAAAFLLLAIRRNAWTFAGSGSVSTTITANEAIVRIAACPVCRGVHAARPRCDFHAGTLDGLARVLLGPSGRAREVACMARGDPECVFVMEWGPTHEGAAD